MIHRTIAVSADPIMTAWLRAMMAKTRHRARRAGMTHDLPDGCIEELFRNQKGLCAISGLPFSLTTFADVLVRHPFAPSLDRILSNDGYTAGNVRLVCVAVNFGMGQWGEELYMTFARAAVERDAAALCLNNAASKPDRKRDAPDLRDSADAARVSALAERLAAAQAVAQALSGKSLTRQNRRIASCQRNVTLGPDGLRAAAERAAATRRSMRLRP